MPIPNRLSGPPTPMPSSNKVRREKQLLESIHSHVRLSSSGRMNSWLYFKRAFQAVPGRAGGAVVMTTVDHTLMRGLEPHDR